VVIGLLGPGNSCIGCDDASSVNYLDRVGVTRHGHDHSPTGVHSNAEGCALHGELPKTVLGSLQLNRGAQEKMAFRDLV
jgi:hypothetical protein